MSATVRLSAKLAADEELNGLDDLADNLVADPSTIRVAVVWLDVQKVTVDTDAGSHVPTVRVRRIEPVCEVADMPDQLRKIITKAHQDRTGQQGLPYDVVEAGDDE